MMDFAALPGAASPPGPAATNARALKGTATSSSVRAGRAGASFEDRLGASLSADNDRDDAATAAREPAAGPRRGEVEDAPDAAAARADDRDDPPATVAADDAHTPREHQPPPATAFTLSLCN